MDVPNFVIQDKGAISREFLKRELFTFVEACSFIQNMAYGRNTDKNDLLTLFVENKGTCSTKHGLLKQLALENGDAHVKLFLGIFKMGPSNTSKVSETLARHNLDYIPEAHTYLKYHNCYFDFTRKGSSPDDFTSDLLMEVEIQPYEISEKKIEIHRAYLNQWLNDNKGILFSLEEIWAIREQCIGDLAE